jgi:hypothetical protein
MSERHEIVQYFDKKIDSFYGVCFLNN